MIVEGTTKLNKSGLTYMDDSSIMFYNIEDGENKDTQYMSYVLEVIK